MRLKARVKNIEKRGYGSENDKPVIFARKAFGVYSVGDKVMNESEYQEWYSSLNEDDFVYLVRRREDAKD